MGDITGNFIGNYATDGLNSQGGAIYNYNAEMGNITGDFIGNYTYQGTSSKGSSQGGAIYNWYGHISDIKGDFIGNSSVASDGNANGGAVFNDNSTIDSINGNFIANSAIYNGMATNDGDKGVGGAIFLVTRAKIGEINGNFIDNYASTHGGGIYLEGNSEIGTIRGQFRGNHINGQNGGFLYNTGSKIQGIYGDFIGNYVDNIPEASSYTNANGGAVFNQLNSGNETYIEKIEGNFIENYVKTSRGIGRGGAIYNGNNGIAEDGARIGSIKGDFIKNRVEDAKSDALGGAILNQSIIGSVQGNFSDNYVTSEEGKAQGGAIHNTWRMEDINSGTFSNNYAEAKTGESAQGGAIYNAGTMTFKNVNFINNYAKASEGKTAQGGAIYTTGDIQIISDNNTSVIQGNYVQTGEGEKVNEAIYVDSPETTTTLKTVNNGKIYLNDKINGKDGYKLDFNGDKTGAIYLNNTVSADNSDERSGNAKAEISLTGANLYLSEDTHLNGNDLTLNTGSMSMINNKVGISNINSLTVSADTDFVADVDLKNKEMDRFKANEYGEHSGNVNVTGMNLLSDANPNEDIVAVYFAEPDLKNNVTNSVGQLPGNSQTTAYTPIYKYNVSYDNINQYNSKGDGGYFLFEKSGFNPAIMSTSVISQSASSAINESFRYAFEHSDAYTKLPETMRQAKLDANKYALSTDYNSNLGSLDYYNEKNTGGWFKPYSVFESIDLKNGPKLNSISYGALAGFDTDLRHLKHGWYNVGTGYVGYMGSNLSYAGNDTYFNGGLLGVTETFYKKNFWTALTASVGAGTADTRSLYGKDDTAVLMTGVASRSGYNFEFKEGRYIFQPIWQMSYTFVNTFDYTNAAGVRIESDPMHSIQLNPKFRFIMNTQNGWQPYTSVGMVWNLMTHSRTFADSIILPNASIKPFVEYGVGLQRNWEDRYTAFGQVMVRNGGRTGAALTAGFRWTLGKDNYKNNRYNNEKVENPQKKSYT